jgi:CHASE2 domain-containing sensor protein
LRAAANCCRAWSARPTISASAPFRASPADKIAVIAIDKQSIDNLGRWPWSREVHAKMIDGLAAAKAKVIASTVFFSEPQIDPGSPISTS